MNPKVVERAWAAGFFDGEGHVSVRSQLDKRRGKSYARISMLISQVDPEVLYRFQKAVGDVGRIYGPIVRKSRPNEAGYYVWETGKTEDARTALRAILPYLSSIKKRDAERALEYRMAWESKAAGTSA